MLKEKTGETGKKKNRRVTIIFKIANEMTGKIKN